jgi:hypothetical protein
MAMPAPPADVSYDNAPSRKSHSEEFADWHDSITERGAREYDEKVKAEAWGILMTEQKTAWTAYNDKVKAGTDAKAEYEALQVVVEKVRLTAPSGVATAPPTA